MSEGEAFVRRTSTPRRVRSGIRLRREAAQRERGWVARRWLDLIEGLIPEAERAAGLEYARIGQTSSLRIEPGAVVAAVQGRAPRPYAVRIAVPVIDAAEWAGIVEAMAAEAIYLARLMARELPESAEPLMAGLGLALLPPADGIKLRCTCPPGRRGTACKHQAAVACLVADRLDDDALNVLTLRGLPGDELVERIAGARAQRSRGPAAAHAEPIEPKSAGAAARPLESCLDSFWRTGPQLAELKRMPPPAHAPHALLRRLGPPPLPGRFPLVGLLASVYDTVAQRALALRDQAERIEKPDP